MGYLGLRLTADDFFALGETTERLELIDGVTVTSPPPSPLHQLLLACVLYQFGLAREGGVPVEALPSTDVQFAPDLVYCPDVVAYQAHRVCPLPRRLTQPPDLVVELLSKGTRAKDLITKRDDYEKHGVGEYWAIDPADLRVRAWQRTPTAPDLFTELPFRGTSVPSSAIPGFTLDLAPLRELK